MECTFATFLSVRTSILERKPMLGVFIARSQDYGNLGINAEGTE